MNQLKLAAKKDKEELESEFKRKIESLAMKYSKYLNDGAITPLSLPVKLKLRIVPCDGAHNKDMRFNGPELKHYQELMNWNIL